MSGALLSVFMDLPLLLDATSNPCYDGWVRRPFQTIMMITRDVLAELQELQEDVAGHFSDENLISGELYWTCVESLATAKLAQLRGEVI